MKIAELLEQWHDSGAKDANGRWAKFAAGDIGAGAMAKWLMASRTHKSGKAAKLKSAYGAIAQQENTSKLISGKQADALRAALKKLNENALNDDIERFMKQRKKRSGILWIGNDGPDSKKPQAMSAKEAWKFSDPSSAGAGSWKPAKRGPKGAFWGFGAWLGAPSAGAVEPSGEGDGGGE